MKTCAACRTDLPNDSYSKKQWKLDQRRCKICVTNNREVRPIPPKQDNNNDPNTNEIIKSLDSMYLDAEKISDEDLFKQPPPADDCPICFLRLPSLGKGRIHQTCCGKVICSGCIHAPIYDNQGNKVDNKKCAYCRTPWPDSEAKNIERMNKRVEVDDPIGIYNLGNWYRDGEYGFSQDYTKALELGHANAYTNVGYSYRIGHAYENGEGVKVNKGKARHYWELAAIGGDVSARHNLGNSELRKGNKVRALKHYMIAVKSGQDNSLAMIKWLYSNGHATKEDYTKALRVYQEYLDEIKSRQRDETAAADEDYCYY